MRFSLENTALALLSIATLTSWYLNPDILLRYRHKFSRRGLKGISEKDESAPKAAWLLAYPTSGSEYVIDTIHKTTQKSTATNYGHVVEEANGKHARNVYNSEPIFLERQNGPFIFSNSLPLPKTYIPVLTNCGGHCIDCDNYILKRDQFIKECLSGKKFEPSIYNNGENGFGFTTDVHYFGGLIHKALELVRNPFQVVESRFFHVTNYYKGGLDWTEIYNPNRGGIYSWCDELSIQFSDQERKSYPQDVYNAAANVPCHAEFYKLIQWHNLIFETIDHMNVPFKTIYYEDFVTDHVNQTKLLLDFYELENVGEIEERKPMFLSNGDFFRMEDKIKIKAFIKMIASNRTIGILDRYLKDIPDFK